MEDSKKEIYASLVKAVNELQNPTNSMENPYFKTSYVPLSDIIDIAKPILGKHGLAVLQYPIVMYEAMNNNKEIAVVKITSSLIHETGETLDFPPMILKASGNTPQAIGSVITYGRRYSLASILGIAGKEEDDDGSIGSGNQGHLSEQNQYGMYQQSGNEIRQHQQLQSQNHHSEQQKQKAKNPHVNVDLAQVQATVINKSEGVSGKGNPYIELTIQNEEGKRISVLVKDEPALSQAKGIEEGTEATFKIMNIDHYHFVKGIEQVTKA